MTNPLLVALTLAAALGSALVGGLFFAFSAITMKALGRLPPAHGIAAMQSINVVVLNRWFFAAFFGTAADCIILAVYSLSSWPAVGATYLLAGSSLYLAGVILVTMAFNVPLNNSLAAVDANSAAGSQLWVRYLRLWTAWNHIRAAAPLLAAAVFMAALR
jgi:uncharacterized membrane protein